ncbi:helix-turn-helix domain-containing protein [Clostridiaceae bacterium UIB06]|uniref:Helix-turn-helix domain-containing protein n=2 Tax=Clostridium thailandense TaxID=2794346 RepID=A0A949X2R5_9CLOT|nr:helix-turn-helix domain-containing protein [Clostridium thailandense]MCH5136407.1 helix-turn-helix domain-containing protein [Clostridiaceae bacterium UIB06]
MTEKQMEKLPALLTVKEMAAVLKIGLNAAYQIIYKKEFCILRIAPRVIRVPSCELIRWIKSGKSKFKFYED